MALLPPFFFILTLLVSSCYAANYYTSTNNEFLDSECLNVAGSDFADSLKSTIQTVREVISIVSKFSGAFGGDFRLSNAIADCLDLLDFSADELTWTLSASQNPTTATGTHSLYFSSLLFSSLLYLIINYVIT